MSAPPPTEDEDAAACWSGRPMERFRRKTLRFAQYLTKCSHSFNWATNIFQSGIVPEQRQSQPVPSRARAEPERAKQEPRVSSTNLTKCSHSFNWATNIFQSGSVPEQRQSQPVPSRARAEPERAKRSGRVDQPEFQPTS